MTIDMSHLKFLYDLEVPCVISFVTMIMQCMERCTQWSLSLLNIGDIFVGTK